ncbi:DUF276 domain-containing protein (plasmid) [Borrelia miyamotoi]|uniref:DUF276 domain-containing protein n=1 Tax=Borrelia miyamotoi TaxID=47466 RepID=A0AAP8YWY0_9SPIR|nr:DUF276 domain-containing protein [Borrelia miyamotoi]MBW6186222.1 DUF276 domain-containing protein [Pseudomonas aeruginosa]AHH05493.1 Hypothetical protein BOM_0950 [Borrelia miyamotoi FR64b]ATQ15285.1 DUF276 domain-containing protein [Borrelia miyamotoi]ATQ16404.1 DUF276 domain-containing protein [Borrelia miyamotoi]ATQ17615.1 DUF276 domain-containing protein [Borrelia miyamotoi]
MKILFDKEIGILTKSIEDIQNLKKEILKKEYNISIKENSIFDIINYPSSAIDLEIIQTLNELFLTLKEEGAYFKKLQKSLSIPISSTHEAIKQSLLAIPNVNHANIISSAGKIAIHLIIDPNYIQDGIIHNEIKMNIGNAIYHTVASGTAFEGNINLEFLNHAEQKKKYKFSLGVIKHAYLKVLYQTETETIYKEIDNQIREIYKKIIQNKYQDMGIAFRHQDFLSPVSLIRELKSIRVGIYVKEKLDNTKITNIKEHEFKFNTDLEINENEIIFFDENLRLIIDRE